MRRLVYRVQALPQSMLPLVWDFGQLDINTETRYIQEMVNKCVSFALNDFMLLKFELVQNIRKFNLNRKHFVYLDYVSNVFRRSMTRGFLIYQTYSEPLATFSPRLRTS